jgi:hypothetical protein
VRAASLQRPWKLRQRRLEASTTTGPEAVLLSFATETN